MPFLAETFAGQLLNESSNLKASGDILVAAQTLVEASDAIGAKK